MTADYARELSNNARNRMFAIMDEEYAPKLIEDLAKRIKVSSNTGAKSLKIYLNYIGVKIGIFKTVPFPLEGPPRVQVCDNRLSKSIAVEWVKELSEVTLNGWGFSITESNRDHISFNWVG
jgi:hypothetical protein